MKKLVLFLFISLLTCKSFAQDSLHRTLFIIDSIPLLNDPEPWNLITNDDISDITIISNRDSIRLLGWENVDILTYVFTKSYRSRPDSIKKIPSLKQLQSKNAAWYLNDTPYTGKYIDYYNSGRIQDEGTLVNGILNGPLIIYRTNGNKKTISHYKEAKPHGTWNEYYPNGALSSTRNYVNGKLSLYQTEYFINGQVKDEVKPKKKTAYDTVFHYYSNGTVKEKRLMINGVLMPDKKADVINFYSPRFFQSLNAGNVKDANKYFYKLWLSDSTSSDTHFKEGLLLLKELRFEDAIKAFDEALKVEPFMLEALAHRAVARIKKYKYAKENVFLKNFKETYISIEDMHQIPESEQEKICIDIQKAREIDLSENYVQRVVPFLIWNYCRQKQNELNIHSN